MRQQTIKQARRCVALHRQLTTEEDRFVDFLNLELIGQRASAIADQAHISPQYLSDVIHKRRKVSAGVLEKFAELDATK